MAGAEPVKTMPAGFYPGRAPIDAVGGGGFRFADMGHRGGLLILPSGMHAWPAIDVLSLTIDDFSAVLAERGKFDFLLLGTGATHTFPPSALLAALAAADIPVEVMTTRAACSTYNVLLNEARTIAAALIAD
jgi:uncharacterized protein